MCVKYVPKIKRITRRRIGTKVETSKSIYKSTWSSKKFKLSLRIYDKHSYPRTFVKDFEFSTSVRQEPTVHICIR